MRHVTPGLLLLLSSTAGICQVAPPTVQVKMSVPQSAADVPPERPTTTISVPNAEWPEGQSPRVGVTATEQWLLAELAATELPTTLKLTADSKGLDGGIHIASACVRSKANGRPLFYVRVELDVVPLQYLQHLSVTSNSSATVVVTNTAATPARVQLRFRQSPQPGSRDSAPRAWVVPFNERTPSDSINQVLAPMSTLVLSTRLLPNESHGWMELKSDRRVVCRAFTRTRASAPTVSAGVYPALSGRTTPLFLTFENTADTSSALIVLNPNDSAAEGRLRLFDANGLALAADRPLRLQPKEMGVLQPNVYLRDAFTNSAVRGLAVIEGADGMPLMAGTFRRSKGASTILPADGPALPRTMLLGLPVLDKAPGLPTTLLVNPSQREEAGTTAIWPTRAARGPQGVIPRANGSPIAEGVSSRRLNLGGQEGEWVELKLAATVGVFGVQSIQATEYVETVEEAKTQTASSAAWSSGPGEAELVVTNPTAENALVFIVTSKRRGMPLEPLRLEVAPNGGTATVRLSGQPASPSDSTGALVELLNMSGGHLVSSLKQVGPIPICLLPVPR